MEWLFASTFQDEGALGDLHCRGLRAEGPPQATVAAVQAAGLIQRWQLPVFLTSGSVS